MNKKAFGRKPTAHSGIEIQPNTYNLILKIPQNDLNLEMTDLDDHINKLVIAKEFEVNRQNDQYQQSDFDLHPMTLVL